MPDDHTLAQLSNQLIYSAMLVYTVALGAFALDLSGRGRAAGGRLQVPGEAVRIRESVVSAVGAGSAAVSAGGPGRADGSAVEARYAGNGIDSADPRRGGARRERAGGIAVALTWLALALHLGAVIARGLAVHRVPWGNMYEFSVSGAVVVTAVFLVVLARRDIRYLGTFIIGPVLLSLGLAVTVFYTQAAQLVPALHSFWLVIHVSVAFIASALFTLGFSTTVLQLVQQHREEVRARGAQPRGARFMDALPSSVDLERSAYRLHVVAFPLWSFTLVAGAIWAEAAWGRYWNWDPKEVWTFVIWVVYAGYLHARVTRGWDGRRAAYVALAGFACLLFNFMVVNFLFVGLHSYAGV